MIHNGSGNLDSFLDVMANLLGVLLVVLAVTLLNLPTAVSEIRQRGRVSVAAPEDGVAAARSVANDLELRRFELARRWAEREGAVFAARAELDALQGLIGDELSDVPGVPDELSSTGDELVARLLELRAERDRLVEDLERCRRHRSDRQEELGSTPEQEAPVDVVVAVPDPRAPSEGARPLVFLCRGGRIAWLDLESMELELRGRLESLSEGRRFDELGYDEIADHLTNLKLMDARFVWDVEEQRQVRTQGEVSRAVVATLRWNGGGVGETATELGRFESEFQEVLRRHDPVQSYGKFLVWPDSFATYQRARAEVAKRGFDAGWVIMSQEQEHRVILAAEIEVPKFSPDGQRELVRRTVALRGAAAGGGLPIGGVGFGLPGAGVPAIGGSAGGVGFGGGFGGGGVDFVD